MNKIRAVMTTAAACAVWMLWTSAAVAQFRAPVDLRSTGEQLSQDPMFQQGMRQAVRSALQDEADERQERADKARLDSLFFDPPQSGLAAYARTQSTLWSKATHSAAGISGYSSNPYQGKSAGEVLGLLEDRYNDLSTPDKRAFEQTINGGGMPTTPTLQTPSLETGALGGNPLPHRPSAFASSIPQPASGGGWLSKAVLNPDPSAPVVVTVEQSQAEAVRRYPALSVAGSPLNREFVARVKGYRAKVPGLFNDPAWPGKVADESMAAIAAGTTVSK